MLMNKLFNDNVIIGGLNKVKGKLKVEKKQPTESLIKTLIDNPDLAEINIKKENNEIVIRIKKQEVKEENAQ